MPPLDSTAAEVAEQVARAQNGDLEAFDTLVARYQTKIYNLCLWFLSDETEASDCAQDAFIRAFRSLKSFRGDAQFSTWLGRIAFNVCRDAHARRRKNQLSFVSPATQGSESLDLAAPTPQPDALLQQRETIEAVHRALLRLSPDHRAVLVLYDLQGHSYQECAHILGVREGTLKSRLNRARLALKSIFEEEGELFSP